MTVLQNEDVEYRVIGNPFVEVGTRSGRWSLEYHLLNDQTCVEDLTTYNGENVHESQSMNTG